MIANRNFENSGPLTWVGRVPVYLSTVLAVGLTAAMVMTAFANAAGAVGLLNALVFSPQSALHGLRVWQFFTYPLYVEPAPWTALQIFFLAVFGRDVEKFIGRSSFAWLFGILVLATPVFLCALNFLGIYTPPFAGPFEVLFAIFIAFVLIYPSAEIFFSIQAKWIGLALLGINSLQLISHALWIELAVLWLGCAVAALWLAREGVLSIPLPAFVEDWRLRQAQRHFRVVEKESAPRASVHESIDPILEKIAKRGIGSLSRSERERLEQARAVLLEKEKTRS